jgi:hypothetical protein
MKLNLKKSLKIVTLLISAIVIGTASAASYLTLSMSSTVTVATSDVKFVTGTDSTAAGLTIDTPPTSATFSSLTAYPNVTTTYDDAAGVQNSAASSTYQLRLRPVSFSDNSADQFKFITFILKDTSSANVAVLNYTSNGSTWTEPSTTDWTTETIAAGTTWSIAIETQAADTATSGSVNIVIAVDVQ